MKSPTLPNDLTLDEVGIIHEALIYAVESASKLDAFESEEKFTRVLARVSKLIQDFPSPASPPIPEEPAHPAECDCPQCTGALHFVTKQIATDGTREPGELEVRKIPFTINGRSGFPLTPSE